MYKKEPKIPTLLGIFLLLIGLGSLIFLVENSQSLFSRASGDTTPQTVTITNITNTSFTVTWLTPTPTKSYVLYQENSLTTTPHIAFDERDGSDPQKRQIHSVTVQNVIPERNYSFTIVNDGKKYEDGRYTAVTGVNLPAPFHTQDPTFGTVRTQNDEPPSEALVYASFDGSQTASALIKTDGSWVIPLGTLRSQDLKRYYVPKKTDTEHIFFISPEGQSTITTSIANDSPLPQVRIGENYNFLETNGAQSSKLPIIAQANSFTQVNGSANAGFSVIKPAKNTAIPSYLPAFSGTGFSKKQVLITLNGPQLLLGKTVVTESGNWNWTPEKALLPGKYVGTVASFTQNDQPVSETLAFTILKSGSQVLADSTPSASLLPSPLASPSLSPSPTASSSPVPVTGTSSPTIVLITIATMCIAFGILLSKKFS